MNTAKVLPKAYELKKQLIIINTVHVLLKIPLNLISMFSNLNCLPVGVGVLSRERELPWTVGSPA